MLQHINDVKIGSILLVKQKKDFYTLEGLKELDKEFLDSLPTEILTQLKLARKNAANFTKIEESELLIELAPYVEKYVSSIFALKEEIKKIHQKVIDSEKLARCKKLFIQRKVAKKYSLEDVNQIKVSNPLKGEFTELKYAEAVLSCLEDEQKYQHDLKILAEYAAWAIFTEEGKKLHKASILFKLNKKLDFNHLVESDLKQDQHHKEYFITEDKIEYRDGFKLTDPGASFTKAQNEVHYCIYCHKRNKDSCSTGIKDKEGSYKKSVLDVHLTGCPLEEKISEMNILRSQGLLIAALLTAMIDNPLLPATGHRICNDCMKSCIYQAQDPVNIPEIETQTLTEILELPYGFEIYSLFTRWNPLNFKQPLPKTDSNYKILIAGTGPAGFNLAHYLLRDGHMVTAIDGLKIEPIAEDIAGNNIDFKLIKDVKEELFQPLDIRSPGGFGGVAEYGITVRWNKNYLQLIRVVLERNQNFRLFGGIRFGGQIDRNIAFNKLGFDHIALCMGAGSPTIIPLKNNLSRGVRKASDFLMSLQSGGAFNPKNITNLQVRLPAIVIGGGLTAIDTATEILAYYPIEVEKFALQYNKLKEQYGEEYIINHLDEEDQEIAREFLSHAIKLKAEKDLAKIEGRSPNIIKLLREFGGVKILYRKSLQESPAYRLNHEEVENALKEGISFISNISPLEVVLDKYESAKAINTISTLTQKEIAFPARSILIAAGTKPNIIASKEDTEFATDGLYFRALDMEGKQHIAEQISKPKSINIITYFQHQNKAVSFFGDMHPDFSGNVVKAMASSKKGYPVINKVLEKSPAKIVKKDHFFKNLHNMFTAKVIEVVRLTENIVEIIIDAPLAAKNFKPGQFYRLQNFSTMAPVKEETVLAMEAIALTGASVEGDAISLIVLEMGGSANICKLLKKGEPVILMGPTGMPTKILENRTILLAGGGLGNAVLFSIGKAFKQAGSKILYFAAYKKASDLYKIKEIEDASDEIIWSFDQEADFTVNRPQDTVFKGNIISAMTQYSAGNLGSGNIKFEDIDHIIAIGSDSMMNAVKIAKNQQLKQKFKKNPTAIASINSPMQCMMKEVCAACLQKHIDSKTGKEYFVYSCFDQDQDMDKVCFTNLKHRLKQNSLQENLTKLWLEHIL